MLKKYARIIGLVLIITFFKQRYVIMNQTATRLFLCYESLSQKWTLKQITIDLTENEAKKLEDYCDTIGSSESDVIRELIRELPEA